MIKSRCPHCNQKLSVPDKYASRRVKCSKCSLSATVPTEQPKPVPQPVEPEVLTTQDSPTPNAWDDLQLQEPDPDPAPANSNLEPGSGQSQFEDEDDFVRTNLAGIPIRKQAAAETRKKRTIKAALSAIAIPATLIAGLWIMYDNPNDRAPQQIGTFAEDFITILTENNIEAAKELLSPQKTISDFQINELLQTMADIEVLNITSICLYAIGNEEANGYIYSCEVETDRANLSFMLSILDQSQTIALVKATETNGTRGIAPPFYHLFTMTAELNKIVPGGTDIMNHEWWNTDRGFALHWIAIIITIFSFWVLLADEGELNMAAVIFTPYALYLLARIGNRPGLLGVVAGVAAMLPRLGVVAGLIFVPLFMIISIGVAREYGKSFLFGIGLGILPFIFYPILVITKPVFGYS